MIIDYTKIEHIYIVCGKTDMHRGIYGLAAIIMDQYEFDVYSDFVVDDLTDSKYCIEQEKKLSLFK
jgi:hypothetical protein